MKRKDAECRHNPARLFSWYANDGTLCVGCCDCGAVLAGAAEKIPDPTPEVTKLAVMPARVESDTRFRFLPENAVKMCKGMKSSYSVGEWGRVVNCGDMIRFSNGKMICAAHLAQVCKNWPSEYAIDAEVTPCGLSLWSDTYSDIKTRTTLKWREDWRAYTSFTVYDLAFDFPH